MEFLERAGEAVRAVVAVLKRRVDHPRAALQRLARERQPPIADVLAQRPAAQDAEHALEVIARRQRLPRDLVIIERLGDVRLDVVDGPLNARCPVHAVLPPVWPYHSGI